jgi:branched-chain amino acid transport system permease protein
VTIANLAAIVISGLVLGSLYVLISTGVALVWGTLNVFNFVHGTQIALAAYIAWSVADRAGLAAGLIWGFIISLAALAVVGVVIERLLVKPFLSRPQADLFAMVTTIAGASLLQNAIQIVWGPRLKQLPRVATGKIEILGTAIGVHETVIMVVAPLVLLALALFLTRTRFGTSIRAVAQNPDAARLTGMNVGAVYAVTFAVASVMAAIAGVLLGAIFFITPTMGNDPLLKAFIVVVFGGLGSLAGTAIAAYVIGLIEAASAFFFGLYVTPVVLFTVMILVMWLRPQGLFGRRA